MATHDRDGGAAGDGALAGMTVLDLTQVMAGPFCTMILADLGADVIKVENPESGDQTRRSWGYAGAGDDSRAFLALNRNKRSITLDLKSDEGRATFYELVRSADVVVENWRPGVAARLGVDYARLAPLNPGLVYASISGFGQTGPYADRPGYDLIAQAMAGVMSITGEPGDRPVKSGIPVADLGSGLFATVGILAAWSSRQRTGQGQFVETSLFEAALALSVWESTEFWATGESPQALGSANRMSAPYQALATRDGFVTVGANNERLWHRLCTALDVEHLADDPRFARNVDRMGHRAELVTALEERLAADDTATWVQRLLAVGVPAGPIQDYRQVLEEDPHVKARGMVQHVEHPVDGAVPVLGSPVRLSGTPTAMRRPPPLLGEHTAEVLGAVPRTARPPAAQTGPPAQDAIPPAVLSRRDGTALHLVLSHPARRNALTWAMYDELQKVCVEARADPDLRVVVIRGAGEAFAAGTDISQFTEFTGAADGLDYERRVAGVLDDLLALPVPVLGVVDGPAVGGGLAIAACCDVLLAADTAVFGAPIARTLGNCLPPAVVARLQRRLGAGRTMAMLLTARTIGAQEAATAGFVHGVVPRGELDAAAQDLARRLASGAPRTVAALKEIDRRLSSADRAVDADDLLADCYGSADFREGVAAFLARRPPEWTGR